MYKIGILSLIVLLAAISACVPSLHQLYTEDKTVFEPALLGTWITEDGKDTCIMQEAGDETKYYDMNYSQEGVAANLEGHLMKFGNTLFLDTYPEEPAVKNDIYKTHLILAHIFSKIDLKGDTVEVAVIDDEWFRDQIASGKVKIANENQDNGFILTANTEELQKFSTDYATDEDAFPNPGIYYRLK